MTMTASFWVLVFSGLLANSSHAQVYRCTDAKGRTTYTDEPCAGSKVLGVDQLRANTTQSLRPTKEEAPATAAPSHGVAAAPAANTMQRQKPAGVCLSPQDVKNIETTASSIRFRDQFEELQFLREEIRLARTCSPHMAYTVEDWKSLEDHRQYQYRLDPKDRAEARRAARAIHARAGGAR